MKLKKITLLSLMIFLTFALHAQERKVKWKRSEPLTQPELQLFHSPHVVDLPTATMMQQWDIEFEISHRFIPTVGSGADVLYGLDGPVNMRLSLALALSNRLIVAIGRSNVNDNIDLWAKYRILQFRDESYPVLVATKLGLAWNSDPAYTVISDRSAADMRNFQLFGQLIFNTMIRDRLGLGIVPSYLYNTDIRFSDETKDTFRLGTYVQYYVSPVWSVYAEWTPFISGYHLLIDQEFNTLTYGIELETGGHFFKIFLSNNKFLNTSQYLAGTDLPVSENDWRLGFMITRLLKFTH